MKNRLLILFIIICSFFIVDNVNAYDNSFVDEGIIVDSSFLPNNKVGDVYRFELDNEDFQNTITIEYKSDGMYMSTDDINFYIMDGSESFLTNSWVLVYSPEYNNMIFYLFNKSISSFFIESQTKESFDFSSSSVTANSCSTSGLTKYKYEINTQGVIWLASQNNNCTVYYGYDWYVYGSNSTIAYPYNNLTRYITSSLYSTKPIIPTIDFSIENTLYNDDNEIIQKQLTLNYNIYDYDKYIYQYALDNNNLTYDELNWLDYYGTSEYVQVLNYNTVFYARVLDKTTNELVASSSFTITGISENIPYIIFKNLDDTECFIYRGNEKYKICDNVSISAKNIDFSQYTLEYSFDNTTWYQHNNKDEKKISIDDNLTFYARILKLSDGSFVDTVSYTVTSLVIPNDGVPFATMKIKCNEDVSYNDMILKIYNYDDTKYNFYYKFDFDEEFTAIEFKQSDNYYYATFSLFHDDMEVYIKITDKEDNYVYGTSLTYTGEYCRTHQNDDVNLSESMENINVFLSNNDTNSNNFFASLLLVIYESAPPRFISYFKVFLTLLFVGTFMYVLGWR